MSTQMLDIEVVNLDELSTEELLRERSDAKVAIARIEAQLKDKDLRPTTPENDSPEWDTYRDWRRRARWAVVHQREELEQIKDLLRHRQDVGKVGHLLAVAAGEPKSIEAQAEIEAREAEGKARGERLQADLAGESAEGLLLRAYRVLRHLLNEHVNTLPDSLDEADRDNLRLVGMFVRKRYGTGRTKAFIDGDGAS
jgi:hypothetical protein